MIAAKHTLVPVAGLLVILVAVASLLIYIQNAPAFEITHIGIRGNVQLSPKWIVEHLSIQPHTNIFQIQLDEIQERLETLQWIKKATVFRSIPNKLRIDIVEREPFALVKLDKLHIIDNDGVVLGALASGSAITLPIITGRFIETTIGTEDEKLRLQEALHAIGRLVQASPPILKDVRKIVIQGVENATFLSYDPEYPEIRLSLCNEADTLERFRRMSQRLEAENLTYAGMAYIDLRFDKRVIVSPNKS
jgi:cell division septal protein FtsQ